MLTLLLFLFFATMAGVVVHGVMPRLQGRPLTRSTAPSRRPRLR